MRPRLVHGRRLCQIETMSLAVKAGAKKLRSPDPAVLLAWYDRHRRALPWRAQKGERADPYRVWLSEIMLQQTSVKAVAPYYARFLARFPTVAALAAAPRDDVLRLWAGLGYYARARNLHACAKAVAERHGGEFPDSEQALRALPGIGAYTAAAIAAIAFDQRASPVDGNIERVVARLFAVEDALPAAKPRIPALPAKLTPQLRAGAGAPLKAPWRRLPGMVTHPFTHFPLELTVYRADVSANRKAPAGTRWTSLAGLAGEALPNVMRKVVAHGLGTDVLRPSRA